MRFPAAALALALLVPAAAAGAATKAPLVLTEKYADKFQFEAGFGWDTVAVAKAKATFTVPFDPLVGEPESPSTAIAIYLGDLDFDSTLGEASKYVPGKSASWVVLDDSTGKPALKVKAVWKNGILKVVAQVKGEVGIFSDFYVGEEALDVPDEAFDGTLVFGSADYEFEGTFAVHATTKVQVKAGDEYDISRVALAGTAEVVSQDFEDPVVDIFDPFQDEEIEYTVNAGTPTFTTIDWSASDDTSLATLEYRVNGGAWTPVPAEVVIDPDFGDASAEGTFDIPTPTGAYTVEIRAVDDYGNETTESVSFTVVVTIILI